ncbi:MAG: C4-dicarboxylate ABC transporter permease [Gammaproteobacteria bacterium]|nr:MAG: C4-dicarboxylate ABC transporter permease [Gammaproteobacteria bacterium]
MSRLQVSLSNTVKVIEKFSNLCGRAVSWLTLLMVLLVFTVVVMRYLFELGSIPLQESITYLHGIIFLMAAAFTLQQDEHVRVDVLYRTMTHQKRAWIDLAGTLFLLFPVCITIFYLSFDYVIISWKINESSGESGGLPALYLLKSLILIMPVLMILQGFANLLKTTLFLFASGPSPYVTLKKAGNS